MCLFPNISYVENFVPLNGPVMGLPPSPKAMFTFLVNRGIVGLNFLDGVNNMQDLEELIFELIDHYPENGASLERIFHLIEIWGGRMGRSFYLSHPFSWDDINPLYNGLINNFTSIQNLGNQTLVRAANAVGIFYEALHEAGYKGMAVAFITKHTRFWMHRNMPNNMLPIYDSTFSEHVMQRGRTANYRDLLPFWQAMVEKAQLENVSLTSLERQLFNYLG